MKDSYLVKKKADEIIVADMSGGIKKEEIMAFNDTLNQTVKGVVSVVENVSSTYRDVSMISAQVEVEYKRLDHALDCLMLKAQRDIQIYQDTLPLLEQNFNSMQNRMDRLMDRALDFISDDCSEESLSRQEAVMKLIEITNESLNKLIVKLLPA